MGRNVDLLSDNLSVEDKSYVNLLKKKKYCFLFNFVSIKSTEPTCDVT